MLEKEFYVIVFESTHHAIKTENMLKSKFSIETIPTPREISASCGLSIKFAPEVFSEIMGALDQEESLNVFRIEKKDNNKVITKVV
ncbi:DUF3343 domain-containing protein [Clostridiaceae bacterium 35-E11]